MDYRNIGISFKPPFCNQIKANKNVQCVCWCISILVLTKHFCYWPEFGFMRCLLFGSSSKLITRYFSICLCSIDIFVLCAHGRKVSICDINCFLLCTFKLTIFIKT